MTPESNFTTVTYMTESDLTHVMTDHVQLDQQESYNRNKGVFNINWLYQWDSDSRTALGKIAKHVVDNGTSAPTAGAVEPETYDYYFNFNAKTGWQATDPQGTIQWFKGVVVRGTLGPSTFHIKTMFPRGNL